MWTTEITRGKRLGRRCALLQTAGDPCGGRSIVAMVVDRVSVFDAQSNSGDRHDLFSVLLDPQEFDLRAELHRKFDSSNYGVFDGQWEGVDDSPNGHLGRELHGEPHLPQEKAGRLPRRRQVQAPAPHRLVIAPLPRWRRNSWRTWQSGMSPVLVEQLDCAVYSCATCVKVDPRELSGGFHWCFSV